MITNDEYLNLVIQQHKDRPKFMATLFAMISPLVHIQNLLNDMPLYFDIDLAIGNQLDIVGQWVGISRNIAIPIVGLYFSWDGTLNEGWDNSIWKSPEDADSGIIVLPDDLFRLVIKAKLMANKSCGSTPCMYAILNAISSVDGSIKIVDNQNMSMTIQIDADMVSSIKKELIVNGYFPIKPAGISITYEEV